MKQAKNIERSLITGVLTDCEELEEILLRVRPEMFFDTKIRTIANAIWSKQTTNTAVIADEVSKYGMDAFELGQVVSASIDGDLSEIMQIVIKRFVSQEMLMELRRTAQLLAGGGDVHEVIEEFDTAKDKIINEHDSTQTPHVSESSKEVKRDAYNAAEGIFTGIPTGHADLDEFTGGWEPTDQIVIGGSSSHGKTTLMLDFAYKLAVQKIPVLIISCESPAKQLTRRLISKISKIPLKELKKGPGPGVDKEAWKKEVAHWTAEIDKLPIYIEESDGGLTKILNIYRANVRNRGVKAVFLDYIQRCSTPGDFNTIDLEYGHVSGKLKSCAMLYGTVNFVLSQLTKAPVQQKREPGRGDLRNGGPLGHDADIIIQPFIPANYEPENPNPVDADDNSIKGLIKLLFTKFRDGDLGVIKKRIDGCFQIKNWDDDFEEGAPEPQQNQITGIPRDDNFDDVPF